ncbi:hypothetical protein SDC9_84611 [bioreactor metagenome]|uniref:Uncharacterized protein n=1 Tax=bioreactor metagenome TaxID=1076179 RepID=A0A644ZCG9_9ZZZZ
MKTLGRKPALLEAGGQHVGHTLGVGKDDDPFKAANLNEPHAVLSFLSANRLDDILLDFGLRLLVALDDKLLRVFLIEPGDVHDLAGNGGREHIEVAVLRGLVDEIPHVLEKAHVEHFIALVKHNPVHGVKPYMTVLKEVNEPTRGCDKNLRIVFEGLDLPVDGVAAVDRDHFDARLESRKCPQVVGNLKCQFPGRGHHKRCDGFALWVGLLHNRYAKGTGLAGSGRGLCHDFTAREQHRKRLALNFSHFFVAHLLDCL